MKMQKNKIYLQLKNIGVETGSKTTEKICYSGFTSNKLASLAPKLVIVFMANSGKPVLTKTSAFN